MSKEHALLRDVIVRHHPYFVGKRTRIKDALANPEMFNITGMIEKCMAVASEGQYTLVDKAGSISDFSDKSDSKTVTVSATTRARRGVVDGDVRGIKTKIGSIRIVIYNSVVDRTDYMFIPADHVHNLAKSCFGKKSYDTRLRLTYNVQRDSYNMFDPFRVPSFKALAKQKCNMLSPLT